MNYITQSNMLLRTKGKKLEAKAYCSVFSPLQEF